MEYIVAKEKAIKYIGISKKTEMEVIKKLKGLGVDSLVIDKIITDIKELGYIDDLDYVNAYIRQNLKMQQYSMYELKQKLLQKGVNADIIEQEFDKSLDKEYEEMVIDKLKRTKLKNYDENKAKTYLYRRGFSVDLF